MQFLSFKSVLIVAWISLVLVVAFAGHVTTLSSWTVVAGIALFPPVLIMWRLNSVPQTLSQSINEARR
jgi:hypothetical protein